VPVEWMLSPGCSPPEHPGWLPEIPEMGYIMNPSDRLVNIVLRDLNNVSGDWGWCGHGGFISFISFGGGGSKSRC